MPAGRYKDFFSFSSPSCETLFSLFASERQEGPYWGCSPSLSPVRKRGYFPPPPFGGKGEVHAARKSFSPLLRGREVRMTGPHGLSSLTPVFSFFLFSEVDELSRMELSPLGRYTGAQALLKRPLTSLEELRETNMAAFPSSPPAVNKAEQDYRRFAPLPGLSETITTQRLHPFLSFFFFPPSSPRTQELESTPRPEASPVLSPFSARNSFKMSSFFGRQHDVGERPWCSLSPLLPGRHLQTFISRGTPSFLPFPSTRLLTDNVNLTRSSVNPDPRPFLRPRSRWCIFSAEQKASQFLPLAEPDVLFKGLPPPFFGRTPLAKRLPSCGASRSPPPFPFSFAP